MAYNWQYPGFGGTTQKDPYASTSASGFGAYPTPAPSTKPTYPGSGMYAPRSQPAPAFATNQGSWGMNLDNPFGTGFPSTGSTFQPPTQKQTYVQAPGPAMGESFTPPSMDTLTADPFGTRTINTQTGGAFVNGASVGNVNPLNVDVLTPPPTFTPPVQTPGFNTPGMQTQYATRDNLGGYGSGWNGQYAFQEGGLDALQPYMNPFLDKIIERGNNNILATASARGHLRSTGLENQLGEWATQAQADAFNDAWNRFSDDRGMKRGIYENDRNFAQGDQINAYGQMTGDRNYMTDAYRDSRNFDYGNFRDTDRWNYLLYGDARDDFNTRMKDWLAANQGIVNTGVNAAGDVGNIQTALGQALALLYGDRGNVGATQATNQGNMTNSFIDALLGLIPTGKPAPTGGQ
jgi:hypothetical protein